MNKEIQELVDFYEKMINPRELTRGMSYDEFTEWVELGTIEEVESAISSFEKENMNEHVEIMKIYIKNKKQ